MTLATVVIVVYVTTPSLNKMDIILVSTLNNLGLRQL